MELPSQPHRRLAALCMCVCVCVCVGVCFTVGTHVVPLLNFQVAVWKKKKPKYRLDKVDG